MSAHKCRIGQMVTYRPDQRGQDVPPGGAYMITARLPESADGQFEYRIRNVNEQHERVAKERELGGMGTAARPPDHLCCRAEERTSQIQATSCAFDPIADKDL